MPMALPIVQSNVKQLAVRTLQDLTSLLRGAPSVPCSWCRHFQTPRIVMINSSGQMDSSYVLLIKSPQCSQMQSQKKNGVNKF